MYAVVSSGGKQYKVQEGEILRVEKIAGDVGSSITFDQVLMVADGDRVNIGQPVLDDALVEGHIVEQGKGQKIIVFKYKRRKRYRRKQGHRQQFTAIKIDSIKAKTAKAPKKAEPKAEAKEEVKKAAPKKVTTPAKVEAKKPAVKEKEVKKPAAKPAAKKAAAPKAKKTETKPRAKKETAAKPAAKKTTAAKTATKKTTAKPRKKTDKTD